ncbi:FtsX-like permease family protein [soil metagenome]
MSLAWSIARRYLVAKKSHNIINIISLVSVVGVGVGSMGLIIVLSVFNGFGNLVLSLYNSFDPDIRITAVASKTFQPEAASLTLIQKIKGVESVTYCLEENALLRYRDRQYIATVKGVSPEFFKTSSLKDKMLDGKLMLEKDSVSYMLLGGQIAYSLGLQLNDPIHKVAVYMPQKGMDPSVAMLDPSSAFVQENITPAGVFSIQQDFDSKYVIVPLSFAESITGSAGKVSSLEIKLSSDADAGEMKMLIAKLTGTKFKVSDRLEQHEFLYKILRSEKAGVYLILGFILLIATFNVFGTLTILIIDKRNDINMLMNMGANLHLIQKIFLLEGLFISLGGALSGMIIGALICGIQQQFGIITLQNSGAFLTEAYPVDMQAQDFLLVLTIVLIIGFSAAWYTSRQIVRRQVPANLL